MATTELSTVLEAFLKSPDFRNGIISSTKAAPENSGYSVELCPDGTWQVLWDSRIGNLYESLGIILALPPPLDTEGLAEYVDGGAGSEDDFLNEAFHNEEEELRENLIWQSRTDR